VVKTTATVTRVAARQFQTSIPRPGCMVAAGTLHSPLYAAMVMDEANTQQSQGQKREVFCGMCRNSQLGHQTRLSLRRLKLAKLFVLRMRQIVKKGLRQLLWPTVEKPHAERFVLPACGRPEKATGLVSGRAEAASSGGSISSAGQLAQDGGSKTNDVRLRAQRRGRCAARGFRFDATLASG
jgi:hypothetical protein